jgi:hypothetical protein
MTILTAAQLRAAVNSALTDTELTALIADEEAELIARLGAHGDGATPATWTGQGGGTELFLSRPAVSVSLVEERAAGGTYTTTAAALYDLWPAEGRLSRVTGLWAAFVRVTYVPVDDEARRRRALIDLCRLTLARTAMRGESVAGEYSYTAPESWEAERARIYRRLTFMSL